MSNELVKVSEAAPEFSTAVSSAVEILQPISQVFSGVAKLYALRLQSKHIDATERQHGRDLRAQRRLDELQARTMLSLARTTAHVELENARLVGVQVAQSTEREFEASLRKIEAEAEVGIQGIRARGDAELSSISARLQLGLAEIAEVGKRNQALLNVARRDLRQREQTLEMLRDSVRELGHHARRSRGLESRFHREMQQNSLSLSVQLVTNPLPLSTQILLAFRIGT